MADGREKFLKYVLERSKKINRGDDCCTSIYLARLSSSFMKLEIYQLLTIRMKWKDLENVYSEVEKKFVCLCHNYYEFTRSALTASYLHLLQTQNVLEGLLIILQKSA